MALHIGISDAGDDIELLSEAIAGRKVAHWYVPSTADVGDEVAIYLHGQGIIVFGTIAERPVKADKPGYYVSDLTGVRWDTPPIPLRELSARFPGWGWTTYPRSYTTPLPEVQTGLEALLALRKDGA